MPRKKDHGAEWTLPMLWPAAAAEAGAALARQFLDSFAPPEAAAAPPEEKIWGSENEVVLDLGAARLRQYAAGSPAAGRRPILVCAPFALHDARIADLCEGHSLMAVLRGSGAPLYLVEWISAEETQAFRRIDDYLADLNVMVDEIGGKADFIGICQGGWLGLLYAARFPAKAGKLVVAAAPIDIDAASSPLSLLAQSTPMETFHELVRLGGGLARGGEAMAFWRVRPEGLEEIHALLDSDLPLDSPQFAAKAALFRAWYDYALDLPGAYYLEVVEDFYKRNALARGEFFALGKRIDLGDFRLPLFLLAARDDEIAAPEQTLACAQLVGTRREAIRRKTVAGSHLHLFMGAKPLKKVWPEILDWLAEPPREG